MIISIYNKGLEAIAKGEIDFESDLRAALLKSSHTTNIATQEFLDDVSTNELSGGGYSAKALAPTVTIEDERAVIGDLADTVWTSLTATNIRHVLVYKHTGTASTSTLLFSVDFEENFSPSSQDFTVFWRLGTLARLLKS